MNEKMTEGMEYFRIIEVKTVQNKLKINNYLIPCTQMNM